jgi:hypothetical protein
VREDAKSSGTLDNPDGPLGTSINPTMPEPECYRPEGRLLWFCNFHQEFHEIPKETT